ncbi:hypothetical protein EJB05_50326, partial [Eragrostis curvula]
MDSAHLAHDHLLKPSKRLNLRPSQWNKSQVTPEEHLTRLDASFVAGQVTGLGVQISHSGSHGSWTIQIMATTTLAASPIHAEAHSLLLGTDIINLLKLQDCDSISDNLALISVMKSSQDQYPH